MNKPPLKAQKHKTRKMSYKTIDLKLNHFVAANQVASAALKSKQPHAKPFRAITPNTQSPCVHQRKTRNMSSPAYIVQYSAKSYAVFGDTKPIKEQLKAVNCRFNKFLVDPSTGKKTAGWILGSKRHGDVCEILRVAVSKPEPVVVVKPTPKPKPVAEPVAEPVVVVKPAPKPEPVAEPVVVVKPTPKPKPVAEPVVVVKPTPKPKPVTEPKVNPPKPPVTFASPKQAYQAALSAGLSAELAEKYREYFTKKRRIQETGRIAETRDASQNKVYDAEHTFSRMNKKSVAVMTEEESRAYFNEVVSSPIYKELSGNKKPSLEFVSIASHVSGYANQHRVALNLNSTQGLTKYTILHELTHTCNNPHHDLKFRVDLVKIVEVFLGKRCAVDLRKAFINNKLKMKMPDKIMEPAEWLKSYNKMASIRNQ